MVVKHTLKELWEATPFEYKMAFLRDFYSYSKSVYTNVLSIALFQYKMGEGFGLRVDYTDDRKPQHLHSLDWDIIMQIIDGRYVEDVNV